MGLTMYLYRATKKNIENLNHLKEVEDDLNKMWSPIIEHELPKNWYGYGKSKMTEQQRKLFDEWNDEFYVISQKRQAIYNEMNAIKDSSEKHTDSLLWSWKKFNTLHKYIIDNFSDGVYDGHVIPLTKDDVVQILNFLNHIVDVMKTLTMVLTDDGNYYYKCQVPDEIKLSLMLIPMDGCFFGKIPTYNFFVHEITKSIDIFSLIAREWDDDYLVWYSALW